jgi:hypothetical protein
MHGDTAAGRLVDEVTVPVAGRAGDEQLGQRAGAAQALADGLRSLGQERARPLAERALGQLPGGLGPRRPDIGDLTGRRG